MENSKRMILDMARRAIGYTDPIIPIKLDNSTAILDKEFFEKVVDDGNKEKFKEEILSDSYVKAGPFTIAYFYPKYGEPFIIKDKFRAILEYYIDVPNAAIVHMRIYEKLGVRNYYIVTGAKGTITNNGRIIQDYIIHIKENKKTHRYDLNVTRNNETVWTIPANVFSKKLRRIPRRWMWELDPYVIV
jgi:hypothetical protein